ncbi:MAG: hypothetical protein H6R18_1328 [Proteobacteria bacterium]|nr:hypothetical protein [Pseudomonadota bacterium]
MTLATRVLLLIVQIPLAAAATETGQLGTLFYTPSERATITASREGKANNETTTGLTLGGIIKREHGKGTVWVNGRPVAEGQPVPPAQTPKINAQGITIDSKSVRVGETVNLVTGERTDIVPPGAVSTGKKK